MQQYVASWPAAVDEPGRVGFSPHRLPDLLLHVVGDRATDRTSQHEAEHLGLDRGVVEPGAARRDAHIVRRHRFDAAGTDLPKRVGGEPGDVVPSRVLLDEAHARGHLEQMAERSTPVLGVGERGHVGGGGIVHRADVALRDRDADQHGGDGLGHRPRGEAMPIVPAVLVALDEDRFAARDEEPGRRVAREVVVERECLAPDTRSGLPARRPRAPDATAWWRGEPTGLRKSGRDDFESQRGTGFERRSSGRRSDSPGSRRSPRLSGPPATKRGAEGADGSAEEDPEAISL